MQTMTCPALQQTCGHRRWQVPESNNKSIHDGFHEGLQPVLDFLYRCRRNHGQIIHGLVDHLRARSL